MKSSHPFLITSSCLRIVSKLYAKLIIYGRMIKFEHSIFALPFALVAMLLAHRVSPVTPRLILMIIIAVVSARSAGMGFNRLVDAKWDAKNPRTANREIPSGTISISETTLFILLSSILFIMSAAVISQICFWYSIPVLLMLFGYSYTKRFTWMSHLALGFIQALGPLGVWLAITGSFSINILPLSIALGTYIAGFDLIYACQDIDFDRAIGLYSMPANLGIKQAFRLSNFLHVITLLSLLSLYWLFSLSSFYLVFLFAIAFFLFIEHKLVSPHDLSRLHIAFFHVNGIISVLFFVAVLTEEFLRKSYHP